MKYLIWCQWHWLTDGELLRGLFFFFFLKGLCMGVSLILSICYPSYCFTVWCTHGNCTCTCKLIQKPWQWGVASPCPSSEIECDKMTWLQHKQNENKCSCPSLGDDYSTFQCEGDLKTHPSLSVSSEVESLWLHGFNKEISILIKKGMACQCDRSMWAYAHWMSHVNLQSEQS